MTDAETTTTTGPDKRRAWLTNSLRAHARDERAAAGRCRKAYRTEPYRSMAHELADAHDEAAAAFERRLAPVSAPPAAPAVRCALCAAPIPGVLSSTMPVYCETCSASPAPPDFGARLDALQQRIIGTDGTCLECGKGYPHKPDCPSQIARDALQSAWDSLRREQERDLADARRFQAAYIKADHERIAAESAFASARERATSQGKMRIARSDRTATRRGP
jgi:hypothetical protein